MKERFQLAPIKTDCPPESIITPHVGPPTAVPTVLTFDHTIHTQIIYRVFEGNIMGIVKIDDDLHEEARRVSAVMCRSINAQAEFWMRIGMLAEASPTLSFNDIVNAQVSAASERLVETVAA